MASNQALAVAPRVVVPRADLAASWTTSACIVLSDLVALSAVYWLAVIGRYIISPGYELRFYLELFPSVIFFLAAFFFQGLYAGLPLHPAEEIRRVFYSITAVFVLIAASTFLWRNAEAYSRSVFLTTWATGVPSVLLARHFARKCLARCNWWGIPAVVLGSGPAAQRVMRALRKRTLGLRVTGVLSEELHLSWNQDFPPVLGGLSSAPQLAASRAAQYAIVALSHGSNIELRHTIQEHCRGFRRVLLMPDLQGVCSLGVSARDIGGEVGFEVPQRLFDPKAALSKRALDLTMSAFILALLAPLFVVVAVAIKLTSHGNVLYGHSRFGRNGKNFKALKFRTMVENADQVLAQHLREHPDQLLEWQRNQKLKNDPRVTAVGKWLRRYSLDELPQLLNVLAGDMSLVGPRPIVKAEIPKYAGGYGLYTRVLPGITGLWQVSGRNNTTYDERVGFDEYYVRNWSIWLDAYILARTVKVVLTAEGAY